MSRTLAIGITGGIGSGKSIICEVFSALGVPVYYSDSRARELMHTNKELQAALKQHFGEEIFEDLKLNTKILAGKVFNNQEKLDLLNSLVHPKVKEDFQIWLNSHSDYSYIVKESALLFETLGHKTLDKCVLVTAPTALRISRVASRDPHRSEEEIKAIISKQMPTAEASKLADYVLKNDEKTLLLPQILKLHKEFLGMAGK